MITQTNKYSKNLTYSLDNSPLTKEKSSLPVLLKVIESLLQEFPAIVPSLENKWYRKSIVQALESEFPQADFSYCVDVSKMKPNGAILSIKKTDGTFVPILVMERGLLESRNHTKRIAPKTFNPQKKIPNLVENAVNFKHSFFGEHIFPYVWFGDGCDFSEDSTILDRVTTIAMFGELNKEYLYTQSDKFNRGSFYFRVDPWTVDEMFNIALKIAIGSVYYYFSKYGKEQFITT